MLSYIVLDPSVLLCGMFVQRLDSQSLSCVGCGLPGIVCTSFLLGLRAASFFSHTLKPYVHLRFQARFSMGRQWLRGLGGWRHGRRQHDLAMALLAP